MSGKLTALGDSRDSGKEVLRIAAMPSFWQRATLFRFFVVGVWNFVFGYGVFAGLYWLLSGVWPDWVIVTIANVIGITNAFVFHRWVTYRSDGVWWREYLRFYVVYGVQALLNVALIYVFVTRCRWNGYAVQFVVSAALTFVSYWLHKCYSFRREPCRDIEA